MEDLKEVSSEEILEISLKIENDGKKFYSDLADRISDPESKKFLTFMSQEESRHEQRILEIFSKNGNSLFSSKKSKELRGKIEKDFQTDLFPDLNELFIDLSELEGIQKALEYALESEMISAEFYALLGEGCMNMEVKTFLLTLEKEELDHYDFLNSLKDKYDNK